MYICLKIDFYLQLIQKILKNIVFLKKNGDGLISWDSVLD